MAKSMEASSVVSDSSRPASWLGAVIGLVAATAIAGGAGIGAAWLLQSGKISGVELVGGQSSPGKSASKSNGTALKGLVAKQVPTIITNLAGDKRVWVRAEFSVLMPVEAPDAEALTAVIGQDAIAFLRSVTPAQIDGPQGMLLLREEIEERVRVRTQGRSQGVLFKTFVIE